MPQTSQKQPAALRGVLLVAAPATREAMRLELADAGPLRVKAASTAKELLAAVPTAEPHALLVELGLLPPQVLRAARELAELSTSRKVPVVIFGGPLPPELDRQREVLCIRAVVDGPYRLQPVLAALRGAIAWADQLKKTAAIRERLKAASEKLKPSAPMLPPAPEQPKP